VNQVWIFFTINLMNRSTAGLQQFELRKNICFGPGETTANALFGIIIASAREESLYSGFI